jgi:anaerobic selenocysteine-containing dehydrogenase
VQDLRQQSNGRRDFLKLGAAGLAAATLATAMRPARAAEPDVAYPGGGARKTQRGQMRAM